MIPAPKGGAPMRPNKSILAGALVAFGLAAAPSTGEAGFVRGVGIYCKDRFHDTLDLFRLRAGFPRDGKAIGLKARVTSLAQVGYVAFDGTYVGLDRRGVGIVDERRREAGVSVAYGSYNEMEPTFGNGFLKSNSDWSVVEDRRILRNLPYWDDGRQRHLSVGAEVATPLFALDVGVYPEEALDFVLGIFAIDIFNDDELFDHYIPYRQATTVAEPKLDGPFAKQRARNAAVKAEAERLAAEKALEEAGQATPADTEAQIEVPMSYAPEGTISDEAAEEAIRALDESATPAPVVEPTVPHEGDTDQPTG